MNLARSASAHPSSAPRREFTLQAETLRKACHLAGGASKLAHHLHVPAAALARWLGGAERPPARVFLDCVDIVLLHERHLLSAD